MCVVPMRETRISNRQVVPCLPGPYRPHAPYNTTSFRLLTTPSLLTRCASALRAHPLCFRSVQVCEATMFAAVLPILAFLVPAVSGEMIQTLLNNLVHGMHRLRQ